MTTITLENDNDLSTKLYIDYKNDLEWQKDDWVINTFWKKEEEILSEIKNKLWN
jgi:hypothetical protein